MSESIDGSRGGLFENNFNDQEQTALRIAFGRGETTAITKQLTAKGITAEGDRQEIFEALVADKSEVTDDDLREVISDLEVPKNEGHTTGKSDMQMDDWLLKLAILNVVNALKAYEMTVTRTEFRQMVEGAYGDLQGT